jgi:hypothetical protein
MVCKLKTAANNATLGNKTVERTAHGSTAHQGGLARPWRPIQQVAPPPGDAAPGVPVRERFHKGGPGAVCAGVGRERVTGMSGLGWGGCAARSMRHPNRAPHRPTPKPQPRAAPRAPAQTPTPSPRPPSHQSSASRNSWQSAKMASACRGGRRVWVGWGGRLGRLGWGGGLGRRVGAVGRGGRLGRVWALSGRVWWGRLRCRSHSK